MIFGEKPSYLLIYQYIAIEEALAEKLKD